MESQDYAEERREHRAGIPAPVRFISAEPLLGPLDVGRWLGNMVQWVIVGGESGPRARPLRQQWALELPEDSPPRRHLSGVQRSVAMAEVGIATRHYHA